jgi:hypothetical protein
MELRRFGRTGWKVSEIGYGMWGMGGWSGSDDAESRGSLECAVEKGCNCFDTAWADGRSSSQSPPRREVPSSAGTNRCGELARRAPAHADLVAHRCRLEPEADNRGQPCPMPCAFPLVVACDRWRGGGAACGPSGFLLRAPCGRFHPLTGSTHPRAGSAGLPVRTPRDPILAW